MYIKKTFELNTDLLAQKCALKWNQKFPIRKSRSADKLYLKLFDIFSFHKVTKSALVGAFIALRNVNIRVFSKKKINKNEKLNRINTIGSYVSGRTPKSENALLVHGPVWKHLWPLV